MSDFDPFKDAGAAPVAEEFDPFQQGAKEEFDPFAEEQKPQEPEKESPYDPAFESASVPKAFIKTLAKSFNVPEEALIQQAYMRGGTVEGETRPVEYIASLAGEALPVSGGTVAAFAQKKMFAPEQRAAFDAIAEEVQKRRSYARAAADLALGIASPIGLGPLTKLPGALAKLGKTPLAKGALEVAGGAATGAGLGATAGVISSEEGKELEAGTVGAALGGVLGGIGATFTRGGTEAVEKGGRGALADTEAKVYQAVEERAQKEAPTDTAIIDSVIGMRLPDARIMAAAKESGELAISKADEQTAISDLLTGYGKLKEENPEAATAFVYRNIDRYAEGTTRYKKLKEQVARINREYKPQPPLTDDTLLFLQEVRDDLADFTRYMDPELAGIGDAKKFSNVLSKVALLRAENSSESLKAKFLQYRESKYANSPEIREQLAEAGLDRGRSWMEKAWAKLAPARYTVNRFDERFGTKLVPLIDEVSRNLNRFKTHAAQLQPQIKTAHKLFTDETKLAGVTQDEANRLVYKFLDGTLSEEEKKFTVARFPKTIEAVKQNFEQFRTTANKLYGYGDEVIKKWGDTYVPHMAMDFYDSAKKIINETQQLHSYKEIAGLKDSDTLSDVISKLRQEKDAAYDARLGGRLSRLQDALQYVTKQEIKTVGDLRKGFDLILKNQGSDSWARSMARAQQIRLGENVPVLIQERDLLKLQEKYVLSTFKAAALDKSLSQLKAQAKVLSAMGKDNGAAKEAADYVRTLTNDMSRRLRPDGMAEWADMKSKAFQIQMLKNAEEAKSGVGRTFWEVASQAPQILQFMSNQMYPSVLSAAVNPIATLVNFTQPFMYSLPELGYNYGTKKLTKAVFNTYKEGPAAAVQELIERGHKGAEWSTALKDALDETTGNTRSVIGRKVGEATNAINSLAMKPFEWAELSNRAVAFNAGKGVADDLVTGVLQAAKGGKLSVEQAGANAYVQRLPEAYKRQVSKLLSELREKADDPKAVEQIQYSLEDIVGSHIIAKTIFNYDKISAGEITRSIVPALMTFTKFPLNVMGDAVDSFATRGFVGGVSDTSKRLLAPSLALYAADQLLQSYDEEVAMEMTLREILSGKSKAGLLRYSIASAPVGMLTGNWASPPIMSPVAALAYASIGDMKAAEKEAKETAKFFLPAPLTNAVIGYDRLAGLGLVPDLME